jgi:hypothetical protein
LTPSEIPKMTQKVKEIGEQLRGLPAEVEVLLLCTKLSSYGKLHVMNSRYDVQ